MSFFSVKADGVDGHKPRREKKNLKQHAREKQLVYMVMHNILVALGWAVGEVGAPEGPQQGHC